jgi:hypothetical protein
VTTNGNRGREKATSDEAGKFSIRKMSKEGLEASIATMETLIQVFALLVAVGITGVVGLGARHWLLNRRLQAVLHTEQLERDTRIAELNKEAWDARQAASGAMEHAAKAEERVAIANRKTEEEKLARMKLEERLIPRQIDLEQVIGLLVDLNPLKGKKVIVFFFSDDPETAIFAQRLGKIMTDAGLVVEFRPGMIVGAVKPGISLSYSADRLSEANILAQALIRAGLVDKPILTEHTQRRDDLTLAIGPKN